MQRKYSDKDEVASWVFYTVTAEAKCNLIHLFGEALRLDFPVPIPAILEFAGKKLLPSKKEKSFSFNHNVAAGEENLFHAKWSLWYEIDDYDGVIPDMIFYKI